MDKSQNEYGIFRGFSKNGIPYWHVAVGRRGYMIEQCFFDGVFGGAEESLNVARAYRDEAMHRIPPMTTFDRSTELRADNWTGVTGIHPVKYKGQLVAWEAMLKSGDKLLRKGFPLHTYGEERAKQEAILIREKWLETMEIAFLADNDLATISAEQNFPEYLENRPEPLNMSDEEIRKRIKALNDRYKALRPLWVFVNITNKKPDALTLYVSDAGLPARKRTTAASLRRHSPGAALAILRAKTAAFLEELFGSELSEAFLAAYGEAFNGSSENPELSFSIRERPDTVTMTG